MGPNQYNGDMWAMALLALKYSFVPNYLVFSSKTRLSYWAFRRIGLDGLMDMFICPLKVYAHLALTKT
jgi:hypothetical protein